MKIKLYISCAITHAPPEYQKMMSLFIQALKDVPWIHVLEFCPPNPGESQSPLGADVVYKNDIEACVKNADVIMSEVSLPSTGLGYEMAVAIEAQKIPTFMYAKEGSKISKLVVGASEIHSHVSFRWYANDIREITEHFLEALQILHAQIQLKKALP